MWHGFIKRFIATETAGGILLMLAAFAALLTANSPAAEIYKILNVPGFRFAVNDGLMTLFFLLVGLELKRETQGKGELSSLSAAFLPILGAAGGMLVPALVYLASCGGDAANARGWAVASATDIAFSLAALRLAGNAVPKALKVFLTALAIIDDVGAILIIALFYTDRVSGFGLASAALIIGFLWVMQARGVSRIGPYLLLCALLWGAFLAAGIHPTLAGVVTGLFVPAHGRRGRVVLAKLEHRLHGWVSYAILPLFAFVNAGIAFGAVPASVFFKPITVGVLLGLVIGKPVGVFLPVAFTVWLKKARLPGGGWAAFLGLCCLCGVGFTMSLFIGGLAFPNASLFNDAKIGILAGSLMSAGVGVALLRRGTKAV